MQTSSTPSTVDNYASPTSHPRETTDLSFVIPVFNEEDSLEELVLGISNNVPNGMSFEILLIDDGSSDSSWSVIQALADLVHEVRGLRFRGNRGKAAGLQVGFDEAVGNLVFTMDADLQDDPKEIPNFLAKLDEGYDLVSGWKKVRHDPWHKVLPSRIFNRMLSYFSQVKLHDHNCGFKLYRREVTQTIKLFGELHLMVPSLAGMQGFRVTEIPVQHHARIHGCSKYGFERFIRGFSDMLTIGFLRKYRERPSHFANAWTGIYLAVAFGLLVLGFGLGITTTQGVVVAMTGLCFAAVSGACFIAGVFCELLIRQNRNHESSPVVNATPTLALTKPEHAKQSNALSSEPCQSKSLDVYHTPQVANEPALQV